MNWTDSKTIPSLLVGTYVCVYLVRVHTDYSWYFPCYTAFGIFKGCRNDFNVVMRGSLKSRTSVPISSFSAISNRQTIFSLNHRALLRVFISEQQGFYWAAWIKATKTFFLNCWSQAKADSGSYNWQLSINLTMAHKQHSKRIRNSAVHLRCPSKCHANYHVALLLFQKEQQSGLPVLYIPPPPHLLARELRPAT